jgi:Na+-driven multidrug efflux pump
VLLRTGECIKIRPRALRLHWDILKKIIRVGIPAAIQMAITGFSNIFVQSYINFFGDACMSGWTTYAKVDAVLFLPMQSIALSSTTFVGQNLGCNQVERAKKGVRTALLMAISSTVILMIPILIFAEPVVAFFNTKPEVVEYGSMLLRWITPFYVVCCFNQIYSGALRGAGNSKAPMVIMLSSFVAFRQVYLFLMSRICNEIIPIAMSYPAGWILCATLTTVYFHRVRLGDTSLVDDIETKKE